MISIRSLTRIHTCHNVKSVLAGSKKISSSTSLLTIPRCSMSSTNNTIPIQTFASQRSNAATQSKFVSRLLGLTDFVAPTKRVIDNQYENPELLAKYKMKYNGFTHKIGTFPDYRSFMKLDIPLSRLWPISPRDAHTQSKKYENEFQNAMFNNMSSSTSDDSVLIEGNIIHTKPLPDSENVKLLHVIENTVAEPNISSLRSLTFEQIIQITPAQTPVYTSERGSFVSVNKLKNYQIVTTLWRRVFEKYEKKASRLEIERYLFILELIRHPGVPNWYIIQHFHHLRSREFSLHSDILYTFMLESLAYHRYGLVFMLLSMHNHGFTYGSMFTTDYIVILCQTISSYINTPEHKRNPELCQGMYTEVSELQQCIKSVFEDVLKANAGMRYTPDAYFYTSMLSTYGVLQMEKDSKPLIDHAFQVLGEKNTSVWNAILSMLNRAGLYEKASEMYSRMNMLGVSTDAATAKELLTILKNTSQADISDFIKFQKQQNKLTTVVMNTVMSQMITTNTNLTNIDKQQWVYNHVSSFQSVLDTSDHITDTTITVLTHDYIPTYHTVMLKLDTQCKYLYNVLKEEYPTEMASIDYRDTSNNLFIQYLPSYIIESLNPYQQMLITKIQDCDAILLCTTPKHIGQSYLSVKHMNLPSNDKITSKLQSRVTQTQVDEELQLWLNNSLDERELRKIYYDNLHNAETSSTHTNEDGSISTSTLGTTMDLSQLHFNTECTIQIPKPHLVQGEYLYSDWINSQEPITEAELEVFDYCNRLCEFIDIDVLDNVTSNTKDTYNLLKLMPYINCIPDSITFTMIMYTLHQSKLYTEMIKVFNRYRLTCLGETMMSGYLLAFALYGNGLFKQASEVVTRLNLHKSNGGSIVGLAAAALKAKDLTSLLYLCSQIEADMISKAPTAMYLQYSGSIYNIFEYTTSAIKLMYPMHETGTKRVVTKEYGLLMIEVVEKCKSLGILHNCIQQELIEPRSITRFLLNGIQAARALRKEKTLVPQQSYFEGIIKEYEGLITQFDPTFDITNNGKNITPNSSSSSSTHAPLSVLIAQDQAKERETRQYNNNGNKRAPYNNNNNTNRRGGYNNNRHTKTQDTTTQQQHQQHQQHQQRAVDEEYEEPDRYPQRKIYTPKATTNSSSSTSANVLTEQDTNARAWAKK